MPKYGETTKQQDIVTYLTPSKMRVEFGFDGRPDIAFREVQVKEVDGERVGVRETRDVEKVIEAGDASTSFDIINENTGAVLGQMTYGQVRHVLYGLYVNIASGLDS